MSMQNLTRYLLMSIDFPFPITTDFSVPYSAISITNPPNPALLNPSTEMIFGWEIRLFPFQRGKSVVSSDDDNCFFFLPLNDHFSECSKYVIFPFVLPFAFFHCPHFSFLIPYLPNFPKESCF